MTEDEYSWFPELTPEQVRDRDQMEATERRLADTVGIVCEGCGGSINGSAGIGAWSYMAPFGTGDYCMRAYCLSCAEALGGP